VDLFSAPVLYADPVPLCVLIPKGKKHFQFQRDMTLDRVDDLPERFLGVLKSIQEMERQIMSV
jgi:hypothetical protein